MQELEFVKKKVGIITSDVALRYYKSKEKKDSVGIAFYNDTETFVTGGKSEYIVVAVLKDRLYFKVSNANEGYKLTSGKDKKGKRIQISASVCPSLARFIELNEGEYPLKFDPDRGLHFILCD